MKSGHRGDPYRWVVLAAFMGVVAMNQLAWITFAPITRDAAMYYGVSDLAIGLLSLVFMAVYILVSMPASWVIDSLGIRVGVGVGAFLTGSCALLRGVLPPTYGAVLAAQIGLAVAQPFVLNAITKVAGRWFPAGERATASGLAMLAVYVGILVGLVATPALCATGEIQPMLRLYGIAAAAAAVLFFLLVREGPPSPVGGEDRCLVLQGLRSLLREPQFLVLLLLSFVGLGAFNSVATWIEDIVRPRGFGSVQAGFVGGVMVAGGVGGAVVFPILSDRAQRRVPFLLLALAGAIPGLLGVALARSYALLLASSFALGAFLLSCGPIGFQYAAEITRPVPEGTSNGLLLMVGQISGILFILGMDALRSPTTGAMTLPLIVLVALLGAGLVLATRLREPRRVED